MSEPEDCDNESCSALEEPDFKTSLKQFQELVEKTVTQKKKERSGLYVKDDVANLLVICITSYICIMEHVINLSSVHDKRIFGYFIGGNGAMSSHLREENKVFLTSEKQQITYPVVKECDMITSVVKVPHLDFTITSSQKGVLTIFNNKMKVLATTNIKDTAWINGCDFLTQLKCVVAVTERTIIVWDYNSIGEKNYFIIKPMENNLLCVCSATTSNQLAEDNILMGDDKGYVNLLKVTSDHFELEQCKGKKESQLQILDSKDFNIVKRKLHDDWVLKVKYISDLNCFGSCSSDSIRSFVLDDIKRLEDNLPVKEFSVPRGVNAFTYCRKAEVIVTGGHDKLLRLWNPNVNTRPTGKLSGHLHSIVEIVTNEKDQHVISLSSVKIFIVWDLQTLSMLQVFQDQGSPKGIETLAMVFDNACGSTVIDIYPLTHVIQDTKQVWDLETGYQIYQIEDAHGLNIEVTCAAIETNGFYLATGACDGTVKIWDFESGQEVKALPLTQHSKDEHCLLKLVYLKANESQHVLLVLEQSGKMKIIQIFVPSVKMKCFDVLKGEGHSLITTGSENGAIILWDFESASVRYILWHAMNGCYLGYFGQPRKLELSDISRTIFPCDVKDVPMIIKEESKHMEKKSMPETDKWKSLTKSPSILKKDKHVGIIQDLKFFKAQASPKVSRRNHVNADNY
ncbi:hypothetical protein ASZ78_015132 [Callipepla squamata]|uniref:Uncharacterized protein n=1 Tax=Callipepla squamata TaxID=9009 RepID=A0A226NH18_CALSU|nr:hypothetical protein ASZ78_015132 [Callipepla squamata]